MAEESGLEKYKSLLEDPSFLEKDPESKFDTLMANMRKDPEGFFKFHQVAPHQFDSLVDLAKPYISLEPRCPALYLSITLRYMSCNDYDDYYPKVFGIGKLHRVRIVRHVCVAILSVLPPMASGQCTKDKLIQNAVTFEELWNFPNCVGAIDVRRVLCQSPESEDPDFELFFLTICDAKYRFIEIHVSSTVEQVETKFLSASYYALMKKASNYSTSMEKSFPLVLVGGKKVVRKKRILRSYGEPIKHLTQRPYNDRFARAKCTIDTALGILFNRWKIFQSPVAGDKRQVTKILKCITVLHNWLLNQEMELQLSERNYLPKNLLHDRDIYGFLMEGTWWQLSATEGVIPLQRCSKISQNVQFYGKIADKIRLDYIDHFKHMGPINARVVTVASYNLP